MTHEPSSAAEGNQDDAASRRGRSGPDVGDDTGGEGAEFAGDSAAADPGGDAPLPDADKEARRRASGQGIGPT